jgi:thioester reductase-like protein
VVGDLTKPLLGLSEEDFVAYGRKVDAIYHSGALVHGVLPYSALRSANVGGTTAILKMAAYGEGRTIVHYISTISVFDGRRGTIGEEYQTAKLVESVRYYSGYSQSKWVAEMLVIGARERGLPVVIYRPGTISGHTQSGYSNKNDFMNRIICGLGQLRSYPEAAINVKMNLAPVDYVSSAIVYLSRKPSSLGKAFHLINPDNSFSLQKVVNYFDSWGLKLQPLPYLQWLRLLKKDKKNVLWPLIASFRDSEDGFPLLQDEDTTYSCKECVKSLAHCTSISSSSESGSGSGSGGLVIDVGQFVISEEIFHRYLTFFHQIGFLPAPGSTPDGELDSVGQSIGDDMIDAGKEKQMQRETAEEKGKEISTTRQEQWICLAGGTATPILEAQRDK